MQPFILELTLCKVINLIKDVSEYVKANEAGTLKYEINRSLRPAKDGTEDIVMIEKYVRQCHVLRNYF